MKLVKKMVALATAASLLGCCADEAHAYECTTLSGCGYNECCASPCLTPAIALGAIAVVAIVAVALQNSHGGHGHSHSGVIGGSSSGSSSGS